MGFTPQQVRAMSVWQYMAALTGYVGANAHDDDKALSTKDQDDLADWMGI